MACTFTVIGFYFRVWLNKNEIYYGHVNVALRQGVLLSVIGSGCLAFQIVGVLTWLTGGLLVAAVTGVVVLIALRFPSLPHHGR